MSEPLVTAERIAEMLNIGRRAVLDMARRGEIPCVRIGHKTLRFAPEVVREYLIEHRTMPAAAEGANVK